MTARFNLAAQVAMLGSDSLLPPERPHKRRCASSEAKIQKSIIDFLRAVLPAPAIVFAIPNASRRTTSGRASNAVAGLLSGVPDLQILLPGKRSVFCEVKTETGRLSVAQQKFFHRLKALDWDYAVLRSIDDAQDMLRRLGVETREAA